jgi:hypothetical protein
MSIRYHIYSEKKDFPEGTTDSFIPVNLWVGSSEAPNGDDESWHAGFPVCTLLWTTTFFIAIRIAAGSTRDAGPRKESRSLMRSSQTGRVVWRCLWTRFDSVLTLKSFNQNLRPVMIQDI